MDTYHILVATDFSGDSHAVLRYAVALAHAHDFATITLLYVEPGVAPLYDERLGILEPNRLMAMMKLRVAERMADVDVPVDERVVYGEPSEKIVEVAVEEKTDLIVMGTHGRTGLDRMLMGSVAESVLRNASCPVLFIKQTRSNSGASDKVSLDPKPAEPDDT